MAVPKGQRYGGRQKGTLNKATESVKSLALPHSPGAIALLAAIMNDDKAPHQARIMAANGLLDRAHGKPPQAHTGEDGAGPVAVDVHHHYDA